MKFSTLFQTFFFREVCNGPRSPGTTGDAPGRRQTKRCVRMLAGDKKLGSSLAAESQRPTRLGCRMNGNGWVFVPSVT